MTSNTTQVTLSTNATEIFSSSVSSSSSDCLVLQIKDFVPWNNPDNIVHFKTEEMVRKLKDLLILPIFFLIGAPANAINMAVFYKHGLKERINVCLFALSLADGLFLVFNTIMYGEQLYIQFTTKEQYGPVFQWITNNHVLGFYGCTRVSQVLSAIIASERCFCILQPLRSQTVLQTSTITIIIVVVFLVVLCMQFIVVTRYKVVCAFDPISGGTIMTLIGKEFYYQHQQAVDFLDVFFFGLGVPWLVIVVVVATTLVTVVKLRQAALWRAESSSSSSSLSARDIALTKMLVANSFFFIVCVLPVSLFRVVQLFMPEVNAGRRHHNLFMMGHWLLNIFSYINSTFNIGVYYGMGSRYRHTVHTMFGCRNVATRDGANKPLSGPVDSKGK